MRSALHQIALGCLSAALLAADVRSASAALLDYAIPPPPVTAADLSLPVIDLNPQTNAPPDLSSNRGLRDEAIRAFHQQRYAEAIALLDRLAASVDLTPNLQRLQAWSATYAGQDERAAGLWNTLAGFGPPQLVTIEMAGWHAFRLDRIEEATARYATCLRLQPQENRLVHMAGLTAWREGRLPAAQRLLVQSIQMKPTRPESLVAMAALQAESRHYPVAAGWLRRALPGLDKEERQRWLTRSEFTDMAAQWNEGWKALLHEYSPELLADPNPAPALDGSPLQPMTNTLQTREGLVILRLSLFAGDPNTRMERIRAYQSGQLLKRLLAEEQLSDVMTLGEYESISGVR